MSFSAVNIGTVADDGTGDPLRTAFSKINANFVLAAPLDSPTLTTPALGVASGASLALTTWVKTAPTHLASLPSASTAGAGARAFIDDALTTLALGLGGTAAAGGSNKVPVYSDGTNWIYG
jgi:hypothetical protein